MLPSGRCGVVETARILAYLAHESARQCGPCTFGLRAISASAGRIAGLASTTCDLEHIQRWSGLLPGRGACRHPDGAAGMLALGFNMILPLGGAADTLCDLAGVASTIVFLGLAEGA